MLKSRCYWSIIIPCLIALSSFTLNAQSPTGSKSDEYLLLGNPNRGAGEPWVFVNPKNPKNILVVAMATLNRLPDGKTPLPHTGPPFHVDPARTALRIKELSTPDGSRTDIAVSQDGGDTWTFSQDDLRKILKKNRCSDSFAGAGPDGTLYMGCLAYLNRGAADYAQGYAPNGEAHFYHGGSAIEWSKDDGKTWSRPVWVHPALSPSLYAPTVHPVFEQASPWDRPVFITDASTDTIYVSGSGLAWTVDPKTVKRPPENPNIPSKGYEGYPPPSEARSRTFIRASHDDGHTWGVIYPMDDDEHPGGAFAGVSGFSAGFGHLIVAYSASKVPGPEATKCPCTVFGVSENGGKTFHYTVLAPLPKDESAAPPAAGFWFRRTRVLVSADPSKDGRDAVARVKGGRIMVSLTEDGGKTWQPPVLVAHLPSGDFVGHVAMKYSPQGNLGFIWKAMYPDKSFDLWSAVSLDGGRSFKTVRVSHAVSPTYNPLRGNFLFGDDLSSLDLDSQYLYAVWGDNRSGFEGTWFGKVPLSAYK